MGHRTSSSDSAWRKSALPSAPLQIVNHPIGGFILIVMGLSHVRADTLIPYELFECFEFTRDGFFYFFRVKFGNARIWYVLRIYLKDFFEHCMQFFFRRTFYLSVFESIVGWWKNIYDELYVCILRDIIYLSDACYTLLKQGSRIQKYLHHRRERAYTGLYFFARFDSSFCFFGSLYRDIWDGIDSTKTYLRPLHQSSCKKITYLHEDFPVWYLKRSISERQASRLLFFWERIHPFLRREMIHIKNIIHHITHSFWWYVLFLQSFSDFFDIKYFCLDFHDSKR